MTERRMCDMLVKNGYVLTMDDRRRIYASGAIAITGRHIAAVGPEHDILAAWQGRRVFDAGGAPVHPGYLEAHLHIVHGTCRGVLEDMAGSAGQQGCCNTASPLSSSRGPCSTATPWPPRSSRLASGRC